MRHVAGLVILYMALAGMPVSAADVDDLEVTIELVDPDDADTAEMMNRIELPFAAANQARQALDKTKPNEGARGRSRGEAMREARTQMRDAIADKIGRDNESRPGPPGQQAQQPPGQQHQQPPNPGPPDR